MKNTVNSRLLLSALLLVLMVSAPSLMAQAEYTPYNDDVYDFLERLDAGHIISNYNIFERPLPRHVIASKLKEALKHAGELTKSDEALLDRFVKEYEFELYGTTHHTRNLIGSKGYTPFDDNNKYIYSVADSAKAAVFVNYLVDIFKLNGSILNELRPGYEWRGSTAVSYGGVLRGTLLDKFGFYLLATDGKQWGNRELARHVKQIRFDYKFNRGNAVTGKDFFNNTEGYLTADMDLVRFKIGRDVKTIGYGPVKYILGDNIPAIDHFSMDMNYKGFSYSYMHGKLLGTLGRIVDPVEGEINTAGSKYFAYHRASFNSRHISLGAGEVVVYSRREIDMAYLNPFAFYKSLEHSNQDRDNSMMFADISNNSIPGLRLTASLMLDDMSTAKIGKGWYGNQTTWSFSLYSSNLYTLLPLDLSFQYVRIEPYVYTHRIKDNSFTHLGSTLASPLRPNSSNIFLKANYMPRYDLKLTLDASYTIHGANFLWADGDEEDVGINVGGSALVGYRLGDNPTVRFLDGKRELYRNVSLTAEYQPWRNYYLILETSYNSNKSQNPLENGRNFYSTFIVNIRI